MLRHVLPVIMFVVCLLLGLTMPVAFEQDFNVLESNKETAYEIECSLEAVEGRVESAFKKGEISQGQWEQFKQLHWEAKSFVHLYIMANLYYEEAPVEPYGSLVELFARDMLQRLLILDRFCIEIGIEAIPSEAV